MASGGRRLNGWRRLWIVLTALGLVAVPIISWQIAYTSNPSEWEYRWVIEQDFANPTCSRYSALPFNELKEPTYRSGGGNCWHIYTSRRYSETGEVPYTISSYDRDKASYRRGQFLLAVGLLGGVVLFLCGLIYFAGWLVNWIRRGFAGV